MSHLFIKVIFNGVPFIKTLDIETLELSKGNFNLDVAQQVYVKMMGDNASKKLAHRLKEAIAYNPEDDKDLLKATTLFPRPGQSPL